jgi:hypothetical protein
MDPTTVTIIVGLATVLASGVTSSWVTYRLSRNHNQTIFLREKAEQLYLSADEFRKSFSGQIFTYFPLLEGRIDYNQMLDLQIAQGSETKRREGAETMTMIVEIYFPSIRPALADVWKARDAYGSITNEIKRAWQRDGDVSDGDWKAKFTVAAQNIDQRIQNLQTEIVAAARIHAGVKQ